MGSHPLGGRASSFRVLAIGRAGRIRSGEQSAEWIRQSLASSEREGREDFVKLHRLTLELVR